ncbi:hypothetical protein GYMLUDRAFT_235050 [Collybiopsis luxurians FD-317 M1]|nr:hypothetical protein GYMLUDRAFT_235050 [Collybiopsis luxurians FD-317 M1]
MRIPSPSKSPRFDFPLLGTNGPNSQNSILSSVTEVVYTSSSSIYVSASKTASYQKVSSVFSTFTTEKSYSVIGTLPPLPSQFESISPVNAAPSPNPHSYSETLATPSTYTSSNYTRMAKRWKIFGIGLIVIASIASMVLLTIFFESWWQCFRNLWSKREEGSEVMVADSAEKTWHLKLSTEDGHRYPSAEFMDQQEKSKLPYHYPMTPMPLFQPPSYFRPAYDRHPLEPLFRRPSTRPPAVGSPSVLPYC